MQQFFHQHPSTSSYLRLAEYTRASWRLPDFSLPFCLVSFFNCLQPLLALRVFLAGFLYSCKIHQTCSHCTWLQHRVTAQMHNPSRPRPTATACHLLKCVDHGAETCSSRCHNEPSSSTLSRALVFFEHCFAALFLPGGFLVHCGCRWVWSAFVRALFFVFLILGTSR